MSRHIDIIEHVVRRLGDLRRDVVFLGGAATGLLVTDPAAAPARFTADVDLIVHIPSRAGYGRLARRLRSLGFREDISEGAPICRWIVEGVKVDVMPTREDIFGFGNRWYESAMRNAEEHEVGGSIIRVVSGPFFLGTKLDAFDRRGEGDYRASRDIEDVVAVIDGRAEIVDEVALAPVGLRIYLKERLGELLGEQRFLEAISGHLPGDSASQERVPLVRERIGLLAGRRRSKT